MAGNGGITVTLQVTEIPSEAGAQTAEALLRNLTTESSVGTVLSEKMDSSFTVAVGATEFVRSGTVRNEGVELTAIRGNCNTGIHSYVVAINVEIHTKRLTGEVAI